MPSNPERGTARGAQLKPVKCQALDMNGRRCRQMKRLKAVRYHGEGELYYEGPEPQWVAVLLCPQHRKPNIKGKVD